MKSGVELTQEPLKHANNGADIKICTGDYLFVTQPEALEALINIHPSIEVRLWNSNGVSFHPKSYMIKDQQNSLLIVGSSNLSRSALTTGIEWNLAVNKQAGREVYEKAVDIFLKEIFSQHKQYP